MVKIDDEWLAYQFDAAVSMAGTAFENALSERVKNGDEYKPRYSLEELLDDDFRLPRDDSDDGDIVETGIKQVHGIKYDEVR